MTDRVFNNGSENSEYVWHPPADLLKRMSESGLDAPEEQLEFVLQAVRYALRRRTSVNRRASVASDVSEIQHNIHFNSTNPSLADTALRSSLSLDVGAMLLQHEQASNDPGNVDFSGEDLGAELLLERGGQRTGGGNEMSNTTNSSKRFRRIKPVVSESDYLAEVGDQAVNDFDTNDADLADIVRTNAVAAARRRLDIAEMDLRGLEQALG